jgi:hypothetical protein
MRTSILSIVIALLAIAGCNPHAEPPADPQLTAHGSIEVTARLIEIPEGAIFQRDLYDYATILKYEVLSVHRGPLAAGDIVFVGHYNPWKPRAEAGDKRVKVLGGTLREFRAGAVHRLALEPSIDDHYMGGIVDKYFGQHPAPAHWAVWTNAAD